MIERWYESVKYEHLCLHEIDDGPARAEYVAAYERIYNDGRPRDRYTQAPGPTK